MAVSARVTVKTDHDYDRDKSSNQKEACLVYSDDHVRHDHAAKLAIDFALCLWRCPTMAPSDLLEVYVETFLSLKTVVSTVPSPGFFFHPPQTFHISQLSPSPLALAWIPKAVDRHFQLHFSS